MRRQPPRFTLTDTPHPYSALCRSLRIVIVRNLHGEPAACAGPARLDLRFAGEVGHIDRSARSGDIGVGTALDPHPRTRRQRPRSEEHTSELQSLMRISYAVFCLKKKNQTYQNNTTKHNLLAQ